MLFFTIGSGLKAKTDLGVIKKLNNQTNEWLE